MAAAAASKAGVNAMLAAFAATRKARAAVLAGLEDAAKAAAAAAADPAAAPSCTYTAAIVVPTPAGTAQITVGNVGDSRAYWFPEPPAPAQQLTVDDSLAQELITAGAAAESEAVQRGAHTLTRWLGADSESEAVVGIERADDHHRRPGVAVAVLRRAVELPARRRRHRTVLQRYRREGGWPRAHRITRWMPAARTTSPSSSSRSEELREFG